MEDKAYLVDVPKLPDCTAHGSAKQVVKLSFMPRDYPVFSHWQAFAR